MNLVFEKWNYTVKEPVNPDEVFWGLDVGVQKLSLIRVSIKNNSFTANEIFSSEDIFYIYDLEKTLKHFIPVSNRTERIYIDRHDKNTAALLSRSGLNICPVTFDILEQIKIINATDLYITYNSKNLIGQMLHCCWNDKINKPYEHFHYHAIDSLGIALLGNRPRYFRQDDISFI